MKNKNIVTEWNTNYVPVKDEQGNIVEDENGRQKFTTENDAQRTVSLKGVASEAAVVGGVIAGIAVATAVTVHVGTQVYDKTRELIRNLKRNVKEKRKNRKKENTDE